MAEKPDKISRGRDKFLQRKVIFQNIDITDQIAIWLEPEPNEGKGLRALYLEAGTTLLHIAAFYDIYHTIDSAQKFETCVNACQVQYGRTPLHLAAISDSYKVASWLIDHEADLGIIDNNGKDEEVLAVEYKSQNTLELFRKTKAQSQ